MTKRNLGIPVVRVFPRSGKVDWNCISILLSLFLSLSLCLSISVSLSLSLSFESRYCCAHVNREEGEQDGIIVVMMVNGCGKVIMDDGIRRE